MLDAAERAIRREGPGVSIEAIAAEAGVTKPIVYARVGDRSELVDALAERFADRLVASAQHAVAGRGDGRDALAALIEANLTTVAEHQELFLYVIGGRSEGSAKSTLYLTQRSTTPLAQHLERWRASQGRDPAVAEPWAYAIIGMLQLVSLWWLNESDRSAAEMADFLSELLWSGLSPS